jgi:small subunit ribosomal protein S6
MSKRLYEGMFVLKASAGAEPGGGDAVLKELFAKHDIDCPTIDKWDERRLAYEIDGERRGVYWLTVLNMDPASVKAFRRDLQYSNDVIRYMLLQQDNLMELRVEREKLAEKRSKEHAHSRRRRRR